MLKGDLAFLDFFDSLIRENKLLRRPDRGALVSDDQGVTWRQIGRVGPKYVYAPHLVVLADDPMVLTAGDSGGQCIFLSTDSGNTWSPPIRIDPGVYGYGKLTLLKDESLLLSYVWQHHAPQRSFIGASARCVAARRFRR